MNINKKDITIIIIIFIIFVLYLYLNNSIEPFTSNNGMENNFQNIINNVFQTIKNELEIVNKNYNIVKSISNIFKNNSYNLKTISRSKNLRVHLNNLIKNNKNNIINCDDMISMIKNSNLDEELFNDIQRIYSNKKDLNTLFVNSDKLMLKVIDVMSKHNWETNEMTHGSDYSVFDDFDLTNINSSITQKQQEIEGNINKFLENLGTSSLFDSQFRNKLKDIFNYLKELNKNLIIRFTVFNLYHMVDKLYQLYEKNNSFDLSNNLVIKFNDANDVLKKNMKDSIENDIKNIRKLIDSDNGNILSDDVEVQYLNTVDLNNNIVYNFCKKIKKLDKPNENNLMFIRFSKEFVDKKNKHIQRLQKEIDDIQKDLYQQEVNDFNSNKLRIDDQSSKQYQAIIKAKENIENSKKLKVNIL